MLYIDMLCMRRMLLLWMHTGLMYHDLMRPTALRSLVQYVRLVLRAGRHVNSCPVDGGLD